MSKKATSKREKQVSVDTSANDVDQKAQEDQNVQHVYQQKMLQQALQTARVDFQRERQALESLEKRVAQSVRDVSAMDAEIGAEKARQDGYREAIAVAAAALPVVGEARRQLVMARADKSRCTVGFSAGFAVRDITVMPAAP